MMDRDALATDAENYDVWCERCQRVHRHYTFTREDYDKVIADGAQNIADAIDRQIVNELLATIK